jgi:Ca2+:H+ antiporter
MRWIERVGYINLLLVSLPISIVLEIRHAPAIWMFATSAAAIIPLAGLMGRSTKMLADRLGPGLGGLLNATFGNAAELIIALFALRAGMVDVVKSSLVGSIVGNVLLVLGASFLGGGMKFACQKFNVTAAGLSATLLALAAIGLVVPAFFHLHLQAHHTTTDEQSVSLEIATVLMLSYLLMLVFSLKTHKHLYAGQAAMDSKDESTFADVEGHWSLWISVTVLIASTALIALMSEFLVGAVSAARQTLGLTEAFVGLIVIAIVGNAAEHSTAVIVALKNRLELSYQIAVGSAIQIALFVAPLLVFTSYGLDRPLDLNFSTLEVVAVVVSVTVVALVAYDGESNWLEGVLLLAVYVILAIAFFNLPESTVVSGES